MEDIRIKEIQEQARDLQEKKRLLLEEKKSIEESDILKRYFMISTELTSLNHEIKKNQLEEQKIRYSLCNHNILFLESYSDRRKIYHPKFKCLDCGKKLFGALDIRQIVINEKYLEYDNHTYLGSLKDYRALCKLYAEYKEKGLEQMQIAVLLEGYLHEKYIIPNATLKLVRRDKNI